MIKVNGFRKTKGTAGRHETFLPRYGWLKKGYERCVADPCAFNRKNAIEIFGVGKNMVRSIRFWCLAFGVLRVPSKDETDEKGALVPGELGRRLLNDSEGWDPYLEDLGSLWLLHWQLFRPPYVAVTWPLVFNYCSVSSFDQKILLNVVMNYVKKEEKLRSISQNSFGKDISCILRMYGMRRESRSEIYSPFTDLGLLCETVDRGHFRFVLGEKRSLNAVLFMAVCFSYAAEFYSEQQTVSLNELVFGLNSPGVVFKLSETDCGELIDEGARHFSGVEFVETAGVRNLQFEGDAGAWYWKMLECYFKGAGRSA